MQLLRYIALGATLGSGVADAAYSVLAENYTPSTFFSKFNFYTGADPTHGFVNYLNHEDAYQAGLVSQDGQTVLIGADKTSIAPGGRRSVRIESKKRYTRGLFIMDVHHMPTGCGTWPAFWTFGDNWPNQGEIDITEGVNLNAINNMALHTSDGCTITGSGHTSRTMTTNCFVNAPNQDSNAGCAIHDMRATSYGAGFNSISGGVYAMEWNSQFIKVWFFPRNAIPANALSDRPDPATWGTPTGQFQGNCDINQKFRDHKIVINTTFCGDWAGGVWGQSGCQGRAATCEAFVANNPGAFAEAYWRIRSLKVWSS